MLGTRGEGPTLPSHDSQLSKLAIAITIPVTHVAKTENSTRSVTSVGIPTPPLCLPVQLHLDTPRHCPSFGAGLTKHHKIFHALAALGRFPSTGCNIFANELGGT